MTYESDLPGERYQRTIPWLPEELMGINGMNLVYTKLSGDYLVHFPGGHSEYLTALRSRGVAVKPPRIWRDKPRVQ